MYIRAVFIRLYGCYLVSYHLKRTVLIYNNIAEENPLPEVSVATNLCCHIQSLERVIDMMFFRLFWDLVKDDQRGYNF